MKYVFHKLTEIYGNMKLQSKFTVALMLAVTVPVLMLGLFFYGRLYDMIVSDTIRQEQDASAKTAPLIAEKVGLLLSAGKQLSNAGTAEEFLFLAEELTDGELITDIHVYVDLPAEYQSSLTADSNQEMFLPMSMTRGTYWHGIFQGSSQTRLFCPSFYLGSREIEEYGDMAYIQEKEITLADMETPVAAYLAIYFSDDPFQQILSDNLSLEGSVSYIINERNNLVAASDTSKSGIYWLNYDIIQDSFMSSNNFIERNIIGKKVYAGFYSIAKANWFMVTILPSDPLLAQSNRIMLKFGVFYLVFLLLALLVATILSRSITSRISSVVSQMNLVRKGPLVPMNSPQAHDEVGDLIDTYNYMTKKLRQLMEDQAKSAEDLRIAEFNSLQAQINPHFLYNTMDMINWLAQQGRTSEVSNAIQKLSRFYKLTLSHKESISTISREIEHISIYVQLQNMRYHNSIEFIQDIPDELGQYPIPKLTLQPVIENSILHGILEKNSKSGTIVITGWLEDSDIILLISDDGVGIPSEKMPTILTGTGQSDSGGTNIAIYNTHRRLQILYGNSYGLSYSSEPGKGTEVQIRIPAQKEYHTPYMNTQTKSDEVPTLSIVTIADRTQSPHHGDLSPETLLDYCQKLPQNLYNIENVHQISGKLHEGEDFYILAHEVTKNFPKHTHGYFELNYLCSGSLLNIIDGNEIYMETGDLIFINPSAVQSLKYLEANTLLLNFCLDQNCFRGTLRSFYEDNNVLSSFFRQEFPSENNYLFFSLGDNLTAQSLITFLVKEYSDKKFRRTYTLEGILLVLFDFLANSQEYSYYGTDIHTHQMVQYLKKNCLTMPLPSIAQHFRYTPEQFETRLRKHTGRNFQSFAQEVQINRALLLLQNPELNIYQIAESCGYISADEFFSTFQDKFHLSPTEYRNQFL